MRARGGGRRCRVRAAVRADGRRGALRAATSSSTCGTSSSRSASTRRRSTSPARRRTPSRDQRRRAAHRRSMPSRCAISEGHRRRQAREVRLQRPGAARRSRPRAEGRRETDIAITYAANPRRGLYFTAPDKDYPKKPLQAWTQGQDEDSRHWYPCIDFPNHQQTSEVIVTVPAKMISIGNGELQSVRENARDGTQHLPLVPGDAARHVPAEPDRRRLRRDRARLAGRAGAVLRPARAARPTSQRTLDRTPEMLAFFSDVDRREVPVRALRADVRRRLHLRRHGEHQRDDADRHVAARQARVARRRRRWPARARAGAPVVRRPADLPRLVARLAQRGLRDVLRGALHRAPQGHRRVPLRALPERADLHGRGQRRATAARSSTTSTTSRSTSSTATCTRRARSSST